LVGFVVWGHEQLFGALDPHDARIMDDDLDDAKLGFFNLLPHDRYPRWFALVRVHGRKVAVKDKYVN
jgi:hypothetical protein